MKVGDLVRWVATHPEKYGIILKEVCTRNPEIDNRIDVLWASGVISKNLYPLSVEVVNESR